MAQSLLATSLPYFLPFSTLQPFREQGLTYARSCNNIGVLKRAPHHRDYLAREDLFCTVLLCILATSSSASVRSILFLSFIVPIFAWKVPLVSLIFLKRSLSLPFYCFPLFLRPDHWGRLSYFFLLFFGILHSDGYVFAFSFPFCFSSFLSYL